MSPHAPLLASHSPVSCQKLTSSQFFVSAVVDLTAAGKSLLDASVRLLQPGFKGLWLSKTFVRHRIRQGQLLLNGCACRNHGHILVLGDKLSIDAGLARSIRQARQGKIIVTRRPEIEKKNSSCDGKITREAIVGDNFPRLQPYARNTFLLSSKESKQAVKEGRLTVNGLIIRDKARRLKAGDVVQLLPAKKSRDLKNAEKLGLSVVWESGEFAATWKPAGICPSQLPTLCVEAGNAWESPRVIKTPPKSVAGLSILALTEAASNLAAQYEEDFHVSLHMVVRAPVEVDFNRLLANPSPSNFPITGIRIEQCGRCMQQKGLSEKLCLVTCVSSQLPTHKELNDSLDLLGCSLVVLRHGWKRGLRSVTGWRHDKLRIDVHAPVPSRFVSYIQREDSRFLRKYNPGIEKQDENGKDVDVLLDSSFQDMSARNIYARGWTEFCGMQFCVSRSTMIPRLGTEAVVRECVQRLHSLSLSGKKPRVLDLGTGCGSICISVLRSMNTNCTSEGVGVDICNEALKVASQNAANLLSDTNANFIPFNLDFRELGLASQQSVLGDGFHLIVSNPPYLSRRTARAILPDESIELEPRQAFSLTRSSSLDNEILAVLQKAGIEKDVSRGIEGGIAAYALIARGLWRHPQLLRPNGFLVLEVPPNRKLSRAVKILFEASASNLVSTGFFHDANGLRRGMIFQKSKLN